MVLRGEDFGRLLDYEGRAFRNGSSAPLALCQWENGPLLGREQAIIRLESADDLILNFQALNRKKYFSVIHNSPPVYGILILALGLRHEAER